jgi:hypothetical protein
MMDWTLLCMRYKLIFVYSLDECLNMCVENIYQIGNCTIFKKLIVNFQFTSLSYYLIFFSCAHYFVIEYGMDLYLCIDSGKE